MDVCWCDEDGEGSRGLGRIQPPISPTAELARGQRPFPTLSLWAQRVMRSLVVTDAEPPIESWGPPGTSLSLPPEASCDCGVPATAVLAATDALKAAIAGAEDAERRRTAPEARGRPRSAAGAATQPTPGEGARLLAARLEEARAAARDLVVGRSLALFGPPPRKKHLEGLAFGRSTFTHAQRQTLRECLEMTRTKQAHRSMV